MNKNWIKELYSIPVWKKYSQCNEECYLEHILNNVGKDKMILELGAWDGFHLSNTRYFIEKGYKALLIDGDNHGNEEVKQHFIYKENVLELLDKYNMPKVFDLFCIDLDGNDIYIIQEVLSKYKPRVVVAEFNAIWDKGQSKAIQYNPDHTWGNDDFYGFSFDAGVKMAEKHGYTCIFQNDNLNMYFVENNALCDSLGITLDEISEYVPEVKYYLMYGHKHSEKTDWIDYE